MPLEDAIFPTFFMGGFECSTFIWKDGQRKDYVAATGHDLHLEADFAAAMDLGIGAVREAIRWPQVDLGRGQYDWSTTKAAQHAATQFSLAATQSVESRAILPFPQFGTSRAERSVSADWPPNKHGGIRT